MAMVETTISSPVLDGPGSVSYFTDFTAPIGTGGDSKIVGVGAGTGTVLALAGEAGHPGIRQISTGASATGSYHTGMVGNAALLGDGPVSTILLARIPVLSIAAQRFNCYHGFFNNVTADPTNGVFFVASDNINSGNWRLDVVVGGVTVSVDSGLAAVANTWVKSSITLSSTRVLAASIGGHVLDVSSLASVALPTATGIWGFNIRKTVGATARVWDADYFGFSYSLNRE